MALNLKIGPTAYEALPADVKKEYKKSGDDYTLDLNGYEDPAELRRARDHEKEAAANAKRDLASAQKDLTAAQKKVTDLEKNGSTNDAALEAAREEVRKDLAPKLEAATNRVTALEGGSRKTYAGRLASEIAGKISNSPKLIEDKIAARLQVELGEDGTPTHKVLGTDGKASAMTLEDLGKEFSTNKDYAPIMLASKGSGGGGAPTNRSGGGAPRATTPTLRGQPDVPDYARMQPADLAQSIRERKEAAQT